MQKIIMVSKFLNGLRKSRGDLNMSWFFFSPVRRIFFVVQRMVSVKQTRAKLRLKLFLNSLIGHICVSQTKMLIAPSCMYCKKLYEDNVSLRSLYV